MLAERAVADCRHALALLKIAVAELGEFESSAVRVGSLARQLEGLIPRIERDLRGERYVCRCCGVESFEPFGMDPDICGPCHNGIHHGHAPTPEVAAENRKQWGREPRVLGDENA